MFDLADAVDLRFGGLESLNESVTRETTGTIGGVISAENGEIMIAVRSYELGENAENVAAIEGEVGKWTWGESLAEERTTEKLAAYGRGLGDSGRGVGRLRMDLAKAGLMNARAGDLTPTERIDLDDMIDRVV